MFAYKRKFVVLKNHVLDNINNHNQNKSTGSPRYMRSFYLRFRIYANEKIGFFLEPIF